MSENTRDAIRAIAAAPEAKRASMVDAFLKVRWPLFNRIAGTLCRNFGRPVANYGEDFASMVAMEAYKMLSEQITDPAALDKVEQWEAMLQVRSRQVVRNFIDKDDAPAAGMSSTLRRYRMLGSLRDEMSATLNRVPTDKEVVDEHNRRMYASRANPVKQGVLATVDDLHISRATAEVEHHDYSGPVEPECVLHPAESPELVRLLVEKTREYNERLGQAAEIWLSGFYSEGGGEHAGEAKDIAERLGVSESTARGYIRKIKLYAIEIVAEQFGITADDV